MADFVAQTIDLSNAARQELLELVEPISRLRKLSGILAKEQDSVRAHFEAKCREAWGDGMKSDGRIMGEWSDVALFRPL